MLKVVDRWTTRDGKWEPNNLPFSITPIAAAKYGSVPGKGAAHAIFVHPPQDAHVVEFNTEDGKNKSEVYAPFPGGWVSFPIFRGYNPEVEKGAWLVRIDGQKVAEGIGLPYGLHVSTFLVVENVASVSEPPVPGLDRWTLYRNGVLVFDSEA